MSPRRVAKSLQTTTDDGMRVACGWTATGSMSANADRESAVSQAMRGLIMRRRITGPRALTPRDVVAVVATTERAQLERMFNQRTLERWMRCDDWRAWELLDWFPLDERADGFVSTAAEMTVRCGYPQGEWWGGRYWPVDWVRGWLKRGLARPRSAWLDEELVSRFGPPDPSPELLRDMRAHGIGTRLRAEVEEQQHEGEPANAELGF